MSRTPEEIFERLVEERLGRPRVSAGKMFGSPVLKVGGKVFAMLVKGRLVVKLPKERVERLVASGTGKPFDPGTAGRRRNGLRSILAPADAGGLSSMKRRTS